VSKDYGFTRDLQLRNSYIVTELFLAGQVNGSKAEQLGLIACIKELKAWVSATY